MGRDGSGVAVSVCVLLSAGMKMSPWFVCCVMEGYVFIQSNASFLL